MQQMSADEQAHIIKCFGDSDLATSSGIRLAGLKFFVLRADPRSIYGKKQVCNESIIFITWFHSSCTGGWLHFSEDRSGSSCGWIWGSLSSWRGCCRRREFSRLFDQCRLLEARICWWMVYNLHGLTMFPLRYRFECLVYFRFVVLQVNESACWKVLHFKYRNKMTIGRRLDLPVL